MEAGEVELKSIEFTKKERCCPMFMIFVDHNMDIKTTKIAEMTGVPLKTVQKIKKLPCKTKDPSAVISNEKVSQEDVRCIRTTEFINKIQKMVNIDPSKSFLSMAKEKQCTDMNVRACSMEDLCCRSYRM